MNITESRQHGVSIFRIQGRLDSNSSTDFEETIASALEKGTKKVLMDFTELEYISSAGLRVILKTTKGLRQNEGKLILCAMQDYIKEIFEISGFDTFIPIVSDSDEGIKQFG